ncbi:hypothetical protein J4573_16250 [Actinomadura barringtoniae]|uniref:Uncharacterized protein n=1 Tax=Actinomadura barringtoniae TaxID=1427535 RepID=A0A939PG98_9ACTN|nr:hypothetical protein [Actinomadura barringtoniae]MBO2448654.1 hypothetical protein [Actinomadura barringtoniae]
MFDSAPLGQTDAGEYTGARFLAYTLRAFALVSLGELAAAATALDTCVRNALSAVND